MRAGLTAGWLVRRARELLEPPRGAGVPPRRLRVRTGAPGARQFALGGAQAAAELAACLPDGAFARFASILDFGCGSARVLPHVAALAPAAACTGCDVDPAAIAWAAAHHPGCAFVVSGAEPPLPFAGGAFDLVYSISVFSHLDEGLGERWLAELSRVLRPGGVALLSVHGRHAFDEFRARRARTSWVPAAAFARGPLGPDEFVHVPYVRTRWNRADLPGVDPGFGLAFHGERRLRERWSPWLEVERVVPRALTDWQDLAVCRRGA
jgi:SAM-dependent methyltransferase